MSSTNIDDPVSEFLEREQNALADLNLESEDFVSPPEGIDNGFFEYAPSSRDNDILYIQNIDNNTDFSGLTTTDTSASFFNGTLNPSVTPNNNIDLCETQIREEPEKIRKWREQQKKQIEAKDEAEEKSKHELRMQATKELQEWHSQRKARLEQRKKHNREQETKYLKDNESKKLVDADATWERISKIIESSGYSKASKNNAIKDTSRMKSVILSKRTGSNSMSA